MRLKERIAQRFWARDGDPGPVAWSLAFASFVLPVVGVGAAAVGVSRLFRDLEGGWTLITIGAAMLAADLVIDLVWAHPGVSTSDEPHLNRRGHQLVGRTGVVAAAIDGGRGRVKIGDGLWDAEGPDLPEGAAVAIVAANSTILRVAPLPAAD